MEGIDRIRRMQVADVDAVLAITAASPEAASWSRQDYEAMLADPARGCCRVAEREGSVVGFVCFRIVGKEAELLNLAVHSCWQRQRIASLLMEQALREAAAGDAAEMFLEMRDSNSPARHLYERLGFEPCGRRPGYYASPPADALLWRRRLPRSTESTD